MEKEKDMEEKKILDSWKKNNIDIYKEVNFMKNLLNFILGRMKIDEFTIDDYKKTVWW